MKKFLNWGGILMIALAVSCTDKEPSGSTEQEQLEPATLEITPETLSIKGLEGSTATAQITSDSEFLGAEVKEAAVAWLKAEIQGTTLKVTAKTEYIGTESRYGQVTVTAGEGINTTMKNIIVEQIPEEPAPIQPEISVNPTSVSIAGAEGSSAKVNITSNVTSVVAKVADGDTWLTASLSDMVLTITASENATGAVRTSTVTVTASDKGLTAEAVINVSQEAKTVDPDPTPTPTPEDKWELGGNYQGGILFYISEDGTTGKAVHTQSAVKAWYHEARFTDFVADSKDDGAANVAKMVEVGIDKFPAANYCHSLEPAGEWYLPASNEYKEIYAGLGLTLLETYGFQITDAEKAADAAVECRMWTSSTNSGGNAVRWAVMSSAAGNSVNDLASKNDSDTGGKGYSGSEFTVRCIRKVANSTVTE